MIVLCYSRQPLNNVTSSQTISEIVAHKACNQSEGDAKGPTLFEKFGGVQFIGASVSGEPAISCKVNKKQ